jgi:hypothetical protein
MVRRREYHWLVALVVALLGLVFPCEVHAGYTHYWTWKVAPDQPRLQRAIGEMNRLVEAKRSILDIERADEDAAAPDKIFFNGVGDGAHEPFVFPGKIGWQFVKTAMKPYDVVVTACLIVARDHFTRDELAISSDGTWDAWRGGRDLYIQVLERQPNDPLESLPTPDDDDDGPLRMPEPKADTSRLRAVLISLGVIGALVVARVLMGGRG